MLPGSVLIYELSVLTSIKFLYVTTSCLAEKLSLKKYI